MTPRIATRTSPLVSAKLGGTFSHREWGGDWRSDKQYGFSRVTMWHGVLEWSSCRHWYIVPFWQDRDGTHSLTLFPSQPWSKETKSSGFEESVGELTNDQDSAKMPEMWIANTNPGRRSTVMEPASATPLNESKFVWWTDHRKGDPGSWTSENGKEAQTARPTRAGVSDEVAQEFQVISNGNTTLKVRKWTSRMRSLTLDEYAKASNTTAMQQAEKTNFSLKTKDEKRSRVGNPPPPDPGSSLPADPLVTLPDRSCTGDPTYELDRPRYYVFDRGSTWKQKACALVKQMDHLLQLICSCPLRDTAMKRHTTEQNMTTVEDGHSAADDGETHKEHHREIQMHHHSKLINHFEAAYKSTCEEVGTTLSGCGWWYERGYGWWWYERERPMMTTDSFLKRLQLSRCV